MLHSFARKTLKTEAVVTLVATVALFVSAHYTALDTSQLPINAIFQVYHLMVVASGALALLLIMLLVGLKTEKFGKWNWLQKLMITSPLFPLLAIEAGWFTAELGRQPWVVYPSVHAPAGIELLTNNAYSQSVTAPEMWATIVLFCAIYLLLFVAGVRLMSKFMKAAPSVSVHEDVSCSSDGGNGGGRPGDMTLLRVQKL